MDLIQKFNERMIGWEQKLSEDEWFFAKFREEVVSDLNAAEAFNLIPQAVELTLQQQEEYLCTECAEILLELARRSETTEMPQELLKHWDDVISHVTSFGEYEKGRMAELCKWYRKHTSNQEDTPA